MTQETVKLFGENGQVISVNKKVFNRVIKMIQQDGIKSIGFRVDKELSIAYTTEYSTGQITLKGVKK
jgi:hypothetical protein